MQQIPNVVSGALDIPTAAKLSDPVAQPHRPRILILYGSLRPQSFSRKLALESQRLLEQLGAETRLFDPHELPMLDSVPATHPKVQELRRASLAEAAMHCYSERQNRRRAVSSKPATNHSLILLLNHNVLRHRAPRHQRRISSDSEDRHRSLHGTCTR